MRLTPLVGLLLLIESFEGCSTRNPAHAWSPADSLRIVREVLAHRTEVDSFFRNDPASPFRRDSTIQYDGIKWFTPNVGLYTQSKLFRLASPETVTVVGTRGEERKHLKYGYFLLNVAGMTLRMNVYKFTPSEGRRYALYKDVLNAWFTDRTTGKETYEVGRYVDVGTESPDPEHVYTVDFNKAYNPYCAYSTLYSCAIPRREDFLDVEIRAGELKYTSHH